MQGALGDFMQMKHQFAPPGTAYKASWTDTTLEGWPAWSCLLIEQRLPTLQVREMHSWMRDNSCVRRLFSPKQLKVVLYGLDEDEQIMLSKADDGDLLLRFTV